MANTSDKKFYGLLGRSIEYSLSPAMHNAAFKHFNIPAGYELFDVQEEEIEDFFKKNVLSGRLSGFNVTIPYKTKIRDFFIEYAKAELKCGEDWVNTVGSINTVNLSCPGGQAEGANTDVWGFVESVKKDLGYDIEYGKAADDNIFIFGGGGAGRAIAIFLSVEHNVYVYDIDREVLRETELLSLKCGTPIASVKVDDLPEIISKCDLVVNATPFGNNEGERIVDTGLLKDTAVVYDLIYKRETELVSGAKARGLKASGGLGMLVFQAAIAFSIWTGEKDILKIADVMQRSALEKIEKRG